jgi:hypothetical protein
MNTTSRTTGTTTAARIIAFPVLDSITPALPGDQSADLVKLLLGRYRLGTPRGDPVQDRPDVMLRRMQHSIDHLAARIAAPLVDPGFLVLPGLNVLARIQILHREVAEPRLRQGLGHIAQYRI